MKVKFGTRLYGKKIERPEKTHFESRRFVSGLNKIYRTFQKAYLPSWTEEVFVVHRVLPGPLPAYKIREWDETPVEGTFYEEDLQKVYVTDIFRVEKVLKRRKRSTGWSNGKGGLTSTIVGLQAKT